MQNIQIEVRNRIARAKYGERIVSDNAGYTITFDFDEEWNDTDRTARFIFDSGYIDVPFSGDTVFVPMLPASVQEVKVGVYSGSLQTTTAATITVVPSCLGSDDTEYIPATDTGIPDAADLAEEDTLRIYDKSAGKLVKATLKKLGETIGGEGGGGTTDHSKLGNRDAADQHPISAITGLEEALTPLTGTTETLTPTQVCDAIKSGKSVLLQHTNSQFGLFTFASFNIFEEEKAVVSTSIAKETGGTYLVGSLVGNAIRNAWIFDITEMAEAAEIPEAVNTALAQAKERGEFDGADGQDGVTPTIGDNGNWYLGETDTGMPSRGEKGDKGDKGDTGETGATGAAGAAGKSAYAYAQDGGYTGTETEFAAKLASNKLPNPYALTFTGAVNETYDGSSAKTIEIPSGGGGGTNLSLVYENTFENIAGINETIDAMNGKENFVFNIEFTPLADSTTAVITKSSILYNGERRFFIVYYWKSAPYNAAYPTKAIYGSVLKLGEGLWEGIVIKNQDVAQFGNPYAFAAGSIISLQYLKDNQCTTTAAGLSVGFDQTVESVKVQIYAG